MFSVLIVCTAFITIATFLPYWRHPHWLIRGLDYPRLQVACLAMVLLLTQLLFGDLQTVSAWALIALTSFCIAWQLWWVLPYTRLWPKETISTRHHVPERQISILTANVLTPNRQAEKLLDLVEQNQPDILVTLESDEWWQDRLNKLEPTMPYSIKCPLDNLYGMHVFSRLPLSETEIEFLVEDSVPSMHALVTLRSGDEVRVHFIHPAPPSPTENTESSERDAELIVVGRSVADSEQAVIVTGDLNDVAWSETTRLFRKLSGLLDPRIGRGMFNTFHVSFPFLRWPLDHLFHSDHFTVTDIRRLPSIGSDHFPLFTCLTLNEQKRHQQSGIDSDQEDEAWASEKAAAENVNKHDVPQPGE